MPLGDVFKRKDKEKEKEKEKRPEIPTSSPSNPEFAFHRPTSPPPDYDNTPTSPSSPPPEPRRNRLSLSPFSRPRASSATSSNSASSATDPERSRRRLSARLHLRRDISSSNIPTDLPAIDVADDAEEGAQTERERQWEKRATLLARSNGAIVRSSSGSPERGVGSLLVGAGMGMGQTLGQELMRERVGVVGDKRADDNIQEAIRLHEEGSLEEATRMFGRLADPGGENNALSQVLYGLALRYGILSSLTSLLVLGSSATWFIYATSY